MHPNRILAIDFARGLAVTLMILSHGVKGLLSFEQFPLWGLVPVHLVTKFSSTIFFMTFGLSLAVSFAPATTDPKIWPAKRKKLLRRGLTILFWYKVLTVIEMSHLHSPREVTEALFYLRFPSYAEILGFYALALLWMPFILPLWQRSSLLLKALWPLGFMTITFLLNRYVDFTSIPQVQALLVESDSSYTWGQLSRAPFVFLGMFIGTFLLKYYKSHRILISNLLGVGALALFAVFGYLYSDVLSSTLLALAQNQGKHPPALFFVLFSLGGALLTFSLSFLGGESGARRMSFITVIGKDTLSAFVFHLSVLFVVYRLILNLWLKVSYLEALALTILLIAMTSAWINLKQWRKYNEGHQIWPRRSISARYFNPHKLRVS